MSIPARVKRALHLLRTAAQVATAAGKPNKADRIHKGRRGLRRLFPVPMAPPAPVAKVFPAIVAARTQSQTGSPMHGEGQCLVYVQGCYKIPPRDPDAIGAWNAAELKHRQTNPVNIPRGYPVFWSGGSAGHGHIAISAGGGKCWSTDIRRIGFFDLVPITEIADSWGLTLLGWTEDLEGVKVVASIP